MQVVQGKSFGHRRRVGTRAAPTGRPKMSRFYGNTVRSDHAMSSRFYGFGAAAEGANSICAARKHSTTALLISP